MALLLVVSGMLLTTLARFGTSEDFVRDRAQALDDLQLAMARLTKDARQAISVDPSSSASVLTVRTYVAGTPTTVSYSISGGRLTRSADSVTTVLAHGLTNAAAFGYEPSTAAAEVVTVTLEVHPRNRPDNDVRVVSEVRLRNQEAS